MAYQALRDQEKPYHHPSTFQHPETSSASESSDTQSSSQPTTHRLQGSPQDRPVKSNRPAIPPLSIHPRIISTVSSSSSPSSVRRKPLPLTASPLATRYSSGERLGHSTIPNLEAPEPERSFLRPYSVDSPTLYEFPRQSTAPFAPDRSILQRSPPQTSNKDRSALAKDNHKLPDRVSSLPVNSPHAPSSSQTITSEVLKHARLESESSSVTPASASTGTWFSDSATTVPESATMSVFSAKPTPPHQINVVNSLSRKLSHGSTDTATTVQKSPLKSPGGSKLGSFFGWGGGHTTQGNTSPVSSRTSISEKARSPIPSPQTPETRANAPKLIASRIKPTAIDVPKANVDTGGYFGNMHLQLPLATPTTPIQVEEMERELKDISAELASSIRREMDLEDLVDRLQAEAQNFANPGKRTSDYFSDSGTSSIRYGDSDSKQDDLERAMRKTEQDKASIRLVLTNKVQEERTRRKQLEKQIHSLEEKASHVDLASMNSINAGSRVKELESTCEGLRRKLAEERQVKDNFEDLLTALKGELETSHDERDNLRDEIVPQLRSRVEGLEAEAAQHEQLSYEQTKMQQELQFVREENMSLMNAQREAAEMQQQMNKFNSIAEESVDKPPRSAIGLTRSSSVAHSGAYSRDSKLESMTIRSRPSSLSRSTSVKVVESRDALAERVKDVELQRDALHTALRSLLDRQEHQNRENQKKIRQLEAERDRALSSAPKRIAYDREVACLREEINVLRRRADEAIEQKWQCEKGLSGLKMDLDRAEQEIGSLRNLLDENDILIPTGTRERHQQNGSRPVSSHISSDSLEQAYMQLRQEYAESLERVKALEQSGLKDEETKNALTELEQNLADAISERDLANQEVAMLQNHTEAYKQAEKDHFVSEHAMADELRETAHRVEQLAVQVHQQLVLNSSLRQRLSETIERGELEQKTNAQKIMMMQSKLKSLEDQLLAAQHSSEESIIRHEEEVRGLKESHNDQLHRVKDGMRSPRLFAPKTPLSPMFANTGKSPRIVSTTSGPAMSVSEDSKMAFLKQRVTELESALSEADKEMEEVVGRMNIAQIEVMELQNEREEAVRETRRLQKAIEEERIGAFQSRFASLKS
ncbi:hypothetical protein BJ878DRAFT_420094 [Calycina marina]|uniref:DUF7603 domain-containing protein n=1 Tax=Calycina marina TaxID=1763456 RepID=A0A9P7Z4J3_9HELO|nr:hypothetical protein BJ878DRAFT_420094 [Calycina marina]